MENEIHSLHFFWTICLWLTKWRDEIFGWMWWNAGNKYGDGKTAQLRAAQKCFIHNVK